MQVDMMKIRLSQTSLCELLENSVDKYLNLGTILPSVRKSFGFLGSPQLCPLAVSVAYLPQLTTDNHSTYSWLTRIRGSYFKMSHVQLFKYENSKSPRIVNPMHVFYNPVHSLIYKVYCNYRCKHILQNLPRKHSTVLTGLLQSSQ